MSRIVHGNKLLTILFFCFCLVAPKIDRRTLRDIAIHAGLPLKFDVNVQGEPPPTITWTVGGVVLKPSDRVEIENVDYNTKVVVRKTVRADAGEYTITAHNSSGRDSATVTVNILGEPIYS